MGRYLKCFNCEKVLLPKDYRVEDNYGFYCGVECHTAFRSPHCDSQGKLLNPKHFEEIVYKRQVELESQ